MTFFVVVSTAPSTATCPPELIVHTLPAESIIEPLVPPMIVSFGEGIGITGVGIRARQRDNGQTDRCEIGLTGQTSARASRLGRFK
jgi:hypothetical protein